MKFQSIFNKKGVTLIELLVALVIAAITLAGIYRVFISQTKTYAIQDQVVETQQNVRSAMEILLRDLRMAGFDDDNLNSIYTGGANSGKPITVDNPITSPGVNFITVTYEYFDRTVGPSGEYQLHTLAYAVETVDGSPTLVRTRTVKRQNGAIQDGLKESLLPNVTELIFQYGEDDNDDDALDRWVDVPDDLKKVIAVRVQLTAKPNPNQATPDVQKVVSPRKLDSIVMIRNLCLR